MPSQSEMTALLQLAGRGNSEARSELFRAVEEKLRGMAVNKLRNERSDHTLQATALVHDAYLKLIGGDRAIDFNDRNHFYVLAAKAMRRILVDHARNKRAQKRGGPHFPRSAMAPEELVDEKSLRHVDEVLALHSALKRIAEIEPRQADVVELRHFGGYTVEETAELLDISPRTVKNDYAAAKAFLFRELSDDSLPVYRA